MSARERAIAASGQRVDPQKGNVRGYGATGFRDDSQPQQQQVETDDFVIDNLAPSYKARMTPANPNYTNLSDQVNELIRSGGIPVFANNRVVGVRHRGTMPPIMGLGLLSEMFDLQPMVYTGLSQYDPYDVFKDYTLQKDPDMPDVVEPVTEVSRDCPDGYMFDPVEQACVPIPTPNFYQPQFTDYQPSFGLLDQVPDNLLEFGQPSDYMAMNRAFRRLPENMG